jgi:hypothetical protein
VSLAADVERWTDLWRRVGGHPAQLPAAVAARVAAQPAAGLLAVEPPSGPPAVAAAFERRSPEVLASILESEPLTVDPDRATARAARDLLAGALERSAAEVVHFPLVDDDSTSARLLAAVPEVSSWERVGSPIVDWSDGGRDLWDRVRSCLGSQADRKRRRFERALSVRRLLHAEAVEGVEAVERKSWKAAAGIDLKSWPGQFEYFAELLRAGVAEASVAFHGQEPAAYRLECQHGSAVYVLKWSFDEAFRWYSPGFYLLTRGLVERWGEVELSYVHLVGHPDSLKAVVETGRRRRRDFAWPGSAAARLLEASAREYDARRENHLATGRGLRHFFRPPAGGG